MCALSYFTCITVEVFNSWIINEEEMDVKIVVFRSFYLLNKGEYIAATFDLSVPQSLSQSELFQQIAVKLNSPGQQQVLMYLTYFFMQLDCSSSSKLGIG